MNKEELNTLIRDCERKMEDILIALENITDEHDIRVKSFDCKPLAYEFKKITDGVKISHSCCAYALVGGGYNEL